MVILRLICLKDNTDICLVVYDSEPKKLLILMIEFSIFRPKHVGNLSIGDFLLIYKNAAYKRNCILMWNTRIFSILWEQSRSRPRGDLDNIDNLLKDYKFVIFNRRIYPEKTTNDLIIL
jgi:hypothetical protein